MFLILYKVAVWKRKNVTLSEQLHNPIGNKNVERGKTETPNIHNLTWCTYNTIESKKAVLPSINDNKADSRIVDNGVDMCA
jgi:hypothetical protein